jgi:hypothetical protein
VNFAVKTLHTFCTLVSWHLQIIHANQNWSKSCFVFCVYRTICALRQQARYECTVLSALVTIISWIEKYTIKISYTPIYCMATNKPLHPISCSAHNSIPAFLSKLMHYFSFYCVYWYTICKTKTQFNQMYIFFKRPYVRIISDSHKQIAIIYWFSISNNL